MGKTKGINNMRDFLVYLAGPINGLLYEEGQDWRNYVSTRLPVEIRAMSPLRGKVQQFVRMGKITGTNEDCPLTSQSGLTTRDRFDCTRADAVIMNLLGATKVSIGTMIEVGWADLAGRPLILVMEKAGNVHDHPMVKQCAGFRVDNLDDAISTCAAILMPEGYGTRRSSKAFDIFMSL
jgi:nucleoside 2-deoxyribosyltransferase